MTLMYEKLGDIQKDIKSFTVLIPTLNVLALNLNDY